MLKDFLNRISNKSNRDYKDPSSWKSTSGGGNEKIEQDPNKQGLSSTIKPILPDTSLTQDHVFVKSFNEVGIDESQFEEKPTVNNNSEVETTPKIESYEDVPDDDFVKEYYNHYNKDAENIKKVQSFLYDNGYYEGVYDKNVSSNKIIDGKFGPNSKIAYQKYLFETKYKDKFSFNDVALNNDIKQDATYVDINPLHKEGLKKETTEAFQKEETINSLIDNYYKKYNKDREKIKVIQKELYDNGYYDGLYKDNTKESIIVDGKLGPKTREALNRSLNMAPSIDPEEVQDEKTIQDKYFSELIHKDDFLERTNNTEQYNNIVLETAGKGFDLNPKTGRSPFRDPKGKLYGCSGDMQRHLQTSGINTRSESIRGDAWTIRENILDGGGKSVFSIFDGSKPSSSLPNGALSKILEVKARNAISSLPPKETLKSGMIVNLFYQNSPNFKIAVKDGKGGVWSTHVGVISQKGNKLYITHSVHGHFYSDPIDNFYNGTARTGHHRLYITAITAPKSVSQSHKFEYIDVSDYGVTPKKEFQETGRGDRVLGYYAADVIRTSVANMQPIKRAYGLTDKEAADIAKYTYGLIWQESQFGQSSGYTKKKFLVDHGGYYLKKFLYATGLDDELSVGLPQIKVETALPESIQKFYGIYNKDAREVLNDPKKAASLTNVILAGRVRYLKEVAKKHPELKLDEEKIMKAALLSHNQGMDFIFERVNHSKELIERQKEMVAKGKLDKSLIGWNFDFLNEIPVDYFKASINYRDEYINFDESKMIKKSKEIDQSYKEINLLTPEI